LRSTSHAAATNGATHPAESFHSEGTNGNFTSSLSTLSNLESYTFPNLSMEQQVSPQRKAMHPDTRKAIMMIEMQLDSPESLLLIPKLISSYTKQSELIKNQVVNIYSTQIEDARVAVDIVDHSQGDARHINSQVSDIQLLAAETKQLMKMTYPTIQHVNETLQNITTTRDWLQRLLRLKSEVTQLYEIIEREVELLYSAYREQVEIKPLHSLTNGMEEDSTLGAPDDFDVDTHSYNDSLIAENLLDVQEHLHQLIQFKIVALEELERNPKELGIFQKFFSFIDELNHSFDVVVEKYMSILTDMAYDDAPKVVMILRIVHREEAYEAELKQNFHQSKLVNYQWKYLKNVLFANLRKSIHRQFKKHLKEKVSVADRLQVLSELPQDIEFIEQYVKPCFPPEYNAMEFFSSSYQDEIFKQINHWMKQLKKLENGDKLAICQWVKDYPSLNEDFFEPFLEETLNFESEFKKLKMDFAHECHERGYRWLENIINNTFADQTKISFQRLNERSPVYTTAPLDFFSSLQGLISSVADMPDFVVLIVDRIRSLLMSFATRYATQIQDHKAELAFETLMAMVNDFKKSVSYIDIFEENVQEALLLLDEPMEYEMNWMQEVRNKFEEEAQRALQILMEHIWETVREEFTLLFSKNWYAESATLVICDTLLDFRRDFETGLEPEFCDWLMDNLEQMFLANYLDQLLTKKVVLKGTAPKIMGAEVEAIKRLFGDDSQAYYTVQSLQLIVATNSIEDPSFMDGMSTLLNHFPDFPMHVAENVLSKCSNHSKTLTKELKECLPGYYRSEPNPNKVITIFSRYKKRELSEKAGRDGERGGTSATNGDAKPKAGVFKKIFKGGQKSRKPSINPLPGMFVNPVPLLVDGSPTSPAPVANAGVHSHSSSADLADMPEVEQIDLNDILGDTLDLGDLGGLQHHESSDSESDSDQE